MAQTVTAKSVINLIDYDPETGTLTWRPRPSEMFSGNAGVCKSWNQRFAGNPALNSRRSGGYLGGKVFDRPIMAHRAAWAIHYGEWPCGDIDHINGCPYDNRAVNLRIVSKRENQRNLKTFSSNTSGHRGVYWHRGQSKWLAAIKVEGKLMHLGTFSQKDDAVAARIHAEKFHGFHENHGRT